MFLFVNLGDHDLYASVNQGVTAYQLTLQENCYNYSVKRSMLSFRIIDFFGLQFLFMPPVSVIMRYYRVPSGQFDKLQSSKLEG